MKLGGFGRSGRMRTVKVNEREVFDQENCGETVIGNSQFFKLAVYESKVKSPLGGEKVKRLPIC